MFILSESVFDVDYEFVTTSNYLDVVFELRAFLFSDDLWRLDVF